MIRNVPDKEIEIMIQDVYQLLFDELMTVIFLHILQFVQVIIKHLDKFPSKGEKNTCIDHIVQSEYGRLSSKTMDRI